MNSGQLSHLALRQPALTSSLQELDTCAHKRNHTRRYDDVKQLFSLRSASDNCADPRNISSVGETMSRGEVLVALRRQSGMSQGAAAAKAGVHISTVVRAEKDGRSDEETLEALAGVYGLTLPELYERIRTSRRPVIGGASKEVKHEADHLSLDVYDGYVKNDLPVIAEGEASPQGELFWDASEGRPLIEAEEWTSRPFDLKDPKAYAIKVRGDSMLPVFAPGMLLIVSPNAHVKAKQGDNAYVQLHSGERLIKRVRKQAGGWILESYNRAYDTRFVPVDEVGSVHRIVYAKF